MAARRCPDVSRSRRRRRGHHSQHERFEHPLCWLSGIAFIELGMWAMLFVLLPLVWTLLLGAWLLAVGAVGGWYLTVGGYRVARHRSTAAVEAGLATRALGEISSQVGSALRSPLRYRG